MSQGEAIFEVEHTEGCLGQKYNLRRPLRQTGLGPAVQTRDACPLTSDLEGARYVLQMHAGLQGHCRSASAINRPGDWIGGRKSSKYNQTTKCLEEPFHAVLKM